MIIVLIIGIILILVGLFFLFKALKLKSETINNTEKEIAKYRNQILELQKQQREKVVEIEDLEDKIDLIQTRIISLQSKEKEIQKQIDDTIKNKQQHIEQAEKKFKQNSQNALSQYEKTLDQAYNLKEKEIYDRIDQLKNEQAFYVTKKFQAQNELDQIKSSIQAATAARLAQEEENNKWMFYTLNLTNDQMKDIVELNVWKSRISDPSLVAKVIWSAFVLKATNELCNRILGTAKKCGIYKITNHETEQVYIGQSINISDRWKAHIKCGLGIDAPATNKLYNRMQQYGVWMFTFELLEECPKEKLNEREKFWIEFYQSDKLGMNSTKGNK